MMTSRCFICTSVLAAACLWAAGAGAVTELRVNGGANLDNDFTLESQESDAETGPPITRTAIAVGDELPRVFEYFAAADITVPRLQILGSYDNTDATGRGNGETPLLFANATLRDTLTVQSPSTEPYLVTAELVVDGTLVIDGSNGRAVASITVDPVDQLSNTASRTYATSGVVTDDVLPVTFGFTGDAEFDLESSLFFFVSMIGANTSIAADFSNTAIVNLRFTDLNGNPLSGFTVDSASGSFGVAPVPLPGALVLLASGMLALGAGARARRRA